MASRSLSPVGDENSNPKSWTPEDDWNLANYESPTGGSVLTPAPHKGKWDPNGLGPSQKGRHAEERRERTDWSLINIESAAEELCHKRAPKGGHSSHAATAQSPGGSGLDLGSDTGPSGSHVDGDWRMINVEPQEEEFVSCSEEHIFHGNSVDYDDDDDEPGPSTGKFRFITDEAGPSTLRARNKWMLINVEPPGHDCSSASRQHEHGENFFAEINLPGPSKAKKYTTILKKSNSGRVMDEDWRLINIEDAGGGTSSESSTSSLAYSTDCSQALQSLKLPCEKEMKKRVHFEAKSECGLFNLCNVRLVEADGSVNVYGTRKHVGTVENIDCVEGGAGRSLLEFKDMLPSNLNTVDSVKEKIQLACDKDALQSKIPVEVNINNSANSNPEDKGSGSRDSPPGGHGSQKYKQQTPLRVGNKPQSHTERMVALFTNLQAKQASPPLLGDKVRKRKHLDGIVADHVQEFDEKRSLRTQEANSSSAAEKIPRPVERIISPPRQSGPGSSSLCGSPRSLQGLEYDKDRKEGSIHTSKQSVEAILVVLQSMRNILVRMAKMGTSTSVDGWGGHDFYNLDMAKDFIRPYRKKAPYKFNCPKDQEVMPDGLFAYSIAHQVVGQAFKKISELYPDCANRVLTEYDPGKDVGERNSVSTALALTAMKDALRDLEGFGADKTYISTAVETSASLANIAVDSMPEEEQFQEGCPTESKKIVLSQVNEIFEIVTGADSGKAKASNNHASSFESSSDVELKTSGCLEAELKQMSFELVSRTMREAVSVLTNTRTSVATTNMPCGQSQMPAALQKKESAEGKDVDTEASRDVANSTHVADSAHQRDDQSIACFMQSISNEVHELISKLFYHLQSIESREELDAIITSAEVDPHAAAGTFASTAAGSGTPESSTLDVRAAEEEPADDMTAGARKADNPQRQDESIIIGTETSVDLSHVEEQFEPVSNRINAQYSPLNNSQFESQTSSSDPMCTPSCSSSEKQRTQSQETCPSCIDEGSPGRNVSKESVATEEACQSNDSTKCVNSSSDTTDSSIERLCDMHLAAAQSRITSRDNLLHSASPQESFEYSSPSALLRLRTADDGREVRMMGSTAFANVSFGRSSDMLLVPTGRVHMAGGNHPEHVQQADVNRPSCSSSPKTQHHLHDQAPKRTATSKSVTASLDAGKRHGCWNCCGPCHHQQRVAKLVGNVHRNKRSSSEPKLDFYKRTKALSCPRTRRRLFDSLESNNSEWTVIGYYPPRPYSFFAGANNEHSEIEDDGVYTVEFGEGITAAEAEAIFGIMAASLPHTTSAEPHGAASASVDGQRDHASTATTDGASGARDISQAETCGAVRSNTGTPEAGFDSDSSNTQRRAYNVNARSGRVNPSPNVHEALANGLLSGEEGFYENKEATPLRNSSTQTCLATLSPSFNEEYEEAPNGSTTSVPSAVSSRHVQRVLIPRTPSSPCCPQAATSEHSAEWSPCPRAETSSSHSKRLAGHPPAAAVDTAQSVDDLQAASAGPPAGCSLCLQGSAASTASASHVHPAAYSSVHSCCRQTSLHLAVSAPDSKGSRSSCSSNREPREPCWKRSCVSMSVDRISHRRSCSFDCPRGSVQTRSASDDHLVTSAVGIYAVDLCLFVCLFVCLLKPRQPHRVTSGLFTNSNLTNVIKKKHLTILT